ncbi:MAG: hypothetical protein IT290_06455 [Deltaproteobacteria bacterium]|nr:hypothetical protein [Deltaproteobacteria bacterium]
MRELNSERLRIALSEVAHAGENCTGDGPDGWRIGFRELTRAATRRLQRRWGLQGKSPKDHFLTILSVAWGMAASTSMSTSRPPESLNSSFALFVPDCQWLVANAHEIVGTRVHDQQLFGRFARAVAELSSILDENHPPTVRLDLPADVALDVLRPTLSYLAALCRKAVALSAELRTRIDKEGHEPPADASPNLLDDVYASLDEELRREFYNWFAPYLPVIERLLNAIDSFEDPPPQLTLHYLTGEVSVARYMNASLSESVRSLTPFGDVAVLGRKLQLVSTVGEVVLKPTSDNSKLLGRGKLLGALIRNQCGCLVRTYGPVTGVRSIDIIR